MQIVRVNGLGEMRTIGAASGATSFDSALRSAFEPKPVASAVGRMPVAASIGRQALPGLKSSAVAVAAPALRSSLSSSAGTVSKAAVVAPVRGQLAYDCGPPPKGALPDPDGVLRPSLDPAVKAWRACRERTPQGFLLPASPSPVAAPAQRETAAAVEQSYAAAYEPAYYAPGPGGGGGGGGGAAPAPGGEQAGADLTQGPSSGGAAVSSSGVYVVAGVVALAAGLGIYLAVR
jgi:hypothetical protein